MTGGLSNHLECLERAAAEHESFSEDPLQPNTINLQNLFAAMNIGERWSKQSF